jgi:hypothetical protein
MFIGGVFEKPLSPGWNMGRMEGLSEETFRYSNVLFLF